MNYRHIYHAGNFADVVKHIGLLTVMEYLKRKEKPLCILDAHGGCGLYQLKSEQALRTSEWKSGVGALLNLEPSAELPESLRRYLALIETCRQGYVYPGSPYLLSQSMRAQDRLCVNELHPDDVKILQEHLSGLSNVKVSRMDAYQFIKANIPPREKRGLVVVDPPFERGDEMHLIAEQMFEWKKRWATGVFVIWYPIKAKLPVDAMLEAAVKSQWSNIWNFVFEKKAVGDGLHACGLLILNTPYLTPEQVSESIAVVGEGLSLSNYESRCLRS